MSPNPLRLFEDAGTSGELRDDLRHAQRAEASAYDVQSGLERFSAFIGAGPTSGIVTSSVGSGGAGAAEAASAGGAGAAGAAAAAEAAAGAGAAAKVASSSLAMKVMAGALVLGLAGAGAARIASPKSRTKSAVAASNETTAASAPEAMHLGAKTVVVATPSSEPGEARDNREAEVDRGGGTPRATAATPVAPVTSAPRGSSASEPAATRSVKEETEHLGALRSAARADHQTALRMADEGHARFPNGIFWQEREVVAITSLLALGRRPEARSRAEAFLARYPDSPSADRVRRAVAPEQ